MSPSTTSGGGPTAALPAPATAPTMYFIGVSTGSSSIRSVFPRWAAELGLGDARLVGIDLPLHAPADSYRRVVEHIGGDPLVRGALVTTHKIDLFGACRGQFDRVDPLAGLMGEVSCVSKRDGQLVASALDAVSAGLALEAIIPPWYWEGTGAEAFVIGAGGAATAISWCLTRPEHGPHRPSRVVVADRDERRLTAVRAMHDELGTDLPVDCLHTPGPRDDDAVLERLAPGALVVNATGLGKDAPGSPLTGAAFPPRAIAWDLNYRGDLVFLDQARAAEPGLGVRAEDGWVYFLHGWTRAIAEVFDVDIPTSGPAFDALGEIAARTRARAPQPGARR